MRQSRLPNTRKFFPASTSYGVSTTQPAEEVFSAQLSICFWRNQQVLCQNNTSWRAVGNNIRVQENHLDLKFSAACHPPPDRPIDAGYADRVAD